MGVTKSGKQILKKWKPVAIEYYKTGLYASYADIRAALVVAGAPLITVDNIRNWIRRARVEGLIVGHTDRRETTSKNTWRSLLLQLYQTGDYPSYSSLLDALIERGGPEYHLETIRLWIRNARKTGEVVDGENTLQIRSTGPKTQASAKPVRSRNQKGSGCPKGVGGKRF